MVFDGDYVYIATERYNKLVKVKYSEFTDLSKWVSIYDCIGTFGIWNIVGGKYNGELIFTESPVRNTIITSTDKTHFIRHYLKGGVAATTNSFLTLAPKNNVGYYKSEIWAVSETLIQDLHRGQVLMVKIVKPED